MKEEEGERGQRGHTCYTLLVARKTLKNEREIILCGVHMSGKRYNIGYLISASTLIRASFSNLDFDMYLTIGVCIIPP